MDRVVTVDAITHRYGDVTALDGADLDVERGEIFALIGPNGAGKTTLVRTITGTVSPTSGVVRVFGSSPDTVVKSRIGLLPQAFAPPERLTGREIIDYYGGLYERSRATDEVLADIGMSDAADRWYERLSGGQQRRICVGTALVNDPDLLILDEPTTGIDPRGRRRVWDLLRALRADDRTVLLTTHDMGEAETLADRVGLLADGEVVTVGEPGDLVERHAGDSRLLVKPNDPVDPDVLDGLDRRVERRNGDLVFPEIAPQDVPGVLGALGAADIAYSRFVWEEPTLEDVYFQLTDGGSE